MADKKVSRRAVLQTAGGLTAVSALGSLSGCSTVSEAITGSSGKAAISTVPEDSQFVLETDITALLGDSALKKGINEELASMREEMQSEDLPEDVTAALDKMEEEIGLDPRSVSQTVLSGTLDESSDGQEDAAYTLWSEWSESEFITAIEEEGTSYTEETYSGKTVYRQDGEMSTSTSIGVLKEGVFSIGTTAHVEATIDVWNGDADALGGDVKAGYDASEDGHMRYAFKVIDSQVPQGENSQFDTSVFTEASHGYGSVHEDGDDRVATLSLEASGEEAATDMSDIIQGALTLAEQQIKDSEMEDSEELVTALDATDVSADGTTVTVSHTRPASEFAAIATPVLLSFVMPQGSREPGQTAPQVSFAFEYDETDSDQGELTVTHEGGDSVAASQLELVGSGFADISGVDQTRPGPWQGSSSDDGLVRAGDRVTLGVTSAAEIRIVWRSEDGDRSVTLSMYEGPDA